MQIVVGIVAFAVSVAFDPQITAASTTPRWAILAVLAPASLFLVKFKNLTLSHLLFLVLIGWSALSMSWSVVPIEWVSPFVKLLLLFFIFCFAAEYDCTKAVLVGCSLGHGINDFMLVAQSYEWSYLPRLQPLSGLWMNKDLGAEFAVMVLVGLFFLRQWWLIPLTLPSIVYPAARGPYFALASLVQSAGITQPVPLAAVVRTWRSTWFSCMSTESVLDAD